MGFHSLVNSAGVETAGASQLTGIFAMKEQVEQEEAVILVCSCLLPILSRQSYETDYLIGFGHLL